MRPLVLAVALTVAAPALAQQAGVDSSAHTLRIDQTLLGPRLVRGGETVPNGGLFNLGLPPIEEVVADSPAALAYARDYSRDVRTVNLLTYGATALYVMGAMDPFDLFGGGVGLGFAVGAAGLAAVAVPVGFRARRSLNQAVETYNEGLER